MWCAEQSYLHKTSAVSDLSEWNKCKKTKKKRDGTHQTNTWCECDVKKNDTFWGKWSWREGYPPGGGETSREISGRGGAPLLSGPTLSEHVTNIVVDGTAALYKHKASASATPLALKTNAQNHRHTHVLTHMSTPTHLPSRRNLHFITLNPIFPDHFHIWYNTDKHREDDFPAYKCTKCAVNMSKLGLYKCHQGSQLECTLLKHTKLKWYQCLRLNHIFFFFYFHQGVVVVWL